VADDGHWVRWHAHYDTVGSSLARRLEVVQRRLGQALDQAPDGPIRVISMCAGQGRDVLGVLADHNRRRDVTARLVELDPVLVRDARAAASAASLDGIEVVEGDASITSAYVGAVPADVVLVCGVFGNVADPDIRRTILELPHLSAPGAIAIWTRHRGAPDLTPLIRSWCREAGYEEVAFDTEEGRSFGVGTHRLVARPRPFRPDRRLFTFAGTGIDAHR
jgi:hypothetical protein